MASDQRFNPYRVVLETPSRLQLRLNGFNRFIHFATTAILPSFIILMLGISMYFLAGEDASGKIWVLLLVLPGPFLMLRVPSWPEIKSETGKIEVVQKKLFKTSRHTYIVSERNHIEAILKKAYKTAGWEFWLVDENGQRKLMFAIPSLPFKSREKEKDNLLNAIQHYTQPPNQQY